MLVYHLISKSLRIYVEKVFFSVSNSFTFVTFMMPINYAEKYGHPLLSGKEMFHCRLVLAGNVKFFFLGETPRRKSPGMIRVNRENWQQCVNRFG